MRIIQIYFFLFLNKNICCDPSLELSQRYGSNEGSKNMLSRTNRIYYQSLMQTKKSQPEGKRIMSEKRFTEFLALSVDPRVGISRTASETDV